MDFEKDLLIDKFNLDEEWVKQPANYNKWAGMLAEAEEVKDRAKENLDLIKSELDLDIRKNPTNYGIDKITESTVASAITVNNKYKKAVDEFLQLRYNYKIIQSAIEALNHKKYALDNLVRLYLSEYYLKDNTTKDSNDELYRGLNENKELKERMKRGK